MNQFMLLRLIIILVFWSLVPAKKMTILLNKQKFSSNAKQVLNSVFSESLHSVYDVIYKGTIAIGTPPKKFDVIFDTGSGMFWLPILGCDSKGPHAIACKNTSMQYNPKESSTSKKLDRTFKVEYSTGSAEGKLFNDILQMGELDNNPVIIQNVTFGGAKRIRYIDFGVVGLSLKASGHPLPVFIQAYQQGHFSKPIFTTYMKKCTNNCEDGGAITLGDFDYKNCEDKIIWAPVIPGTSMWRFKISKMHVGQFLFDDDKYFGITDTGTSYIHFPSEIFEKVIEEIKPQKYNSKQYLLPCDVKLAINFTIHDSQFTITEKELILNQGVGDKCVVAIGDAGQFEMFLLGDSFIRSYCQVYDIQKKRVGFAEIKTS